MIDFRKADLAPPFGRGSTRLGPRVLVIDDDRGLSGTLHRLLADYGYEVDVAHTGGKALEMCREKDYDAFIVDEMLPDMMGTTLLGALGDSSPRSAKMVVTGFPSSSDAMDALSARADAYLVKPFEPRELLHALRKAISAHQGRGGPR